MPLTSWDSNKKKGLILRRYNTNHDRTIGMLLLDNVFQCYTLEDGPRAKKVKGETRIPAGTYTLGIQESTTPLTTKYRGKYKFFTNHLHIKDVPNFTGIYIHIGNTDKHTDGCVLVGNVAYKNTIQQSTAAYKDLYSKLINRAREGNLTITIID